MFCNSVLVNYTVKRLKRVFIYLYCEWPVNVFLDNYIVKVALFCV